MKKLWMVAAATSVLVNLSAQDGSTETQTVGVIIDAHALVDVVDNGLIFDLSSNTPTEAGEGMSFSANSKLSTFLNYSLMLSNGGLADGSISVKASNIKPGVKLLLQADGSAASSLNSATNGDLGTVVATFDKQQGASPVELTASDQTLIENIGSSYTGDGTGKGYELTYFVALDDYALLDADDGNQDVATVTYTIAE